MVVTDKIEVSDQIYVSGGFADVRSGRYMGQHLVAVKIMKVAAQDDLPRIRKVSINVGHSGRDLKPFCPSDFARKSPSGARYPILTS